jgi:hypothetical protein
LEKGGGELSEADLENVAGGSQLLINPDLLEIKINIPILPTRW